MDRLPNEELHNPDYFNRRVFGNAFKCSTPEEIRAAGEATEAVLGHEHLGPWDTIRAPYVLAILETSRMETLALAARPHWILLPPDFMVRLLSSMAHLTTLWLQNPWELSHDEVQSAAFKLQALKVARIGPQAVRSLSQALQSPLTSLQRLSVNLEDCDESSTEGLFQALRHPNCKIWDLDLQGSSYVPEQLWNSKVCKLSGSFCELPDRQCPEQLQHLGISVMHAPSAEWYLRLRSLSVGKLDEMQVLSQVLESSACRLESLVVRESLKQRQETIVEAISSNFQSRLTHLKLDWTSRALEEKWQHLQKRAQLYTAAGVICEQKLVKALTAKLFVCGHGRVGKTTVSRNLCRWHQLNVPHFFQRYSPTVGIDLHTLRFPGRGKLVICDVAGQEEYHAFHHYFVRGSDMDMFLVLCKLSDDIKAVEDSLKYWLRFIVSHQSATPKRKPKVLIAVNDFSRGDPEHQLPLVRCLEQTASRFLKELDIVGAADHMKVFRVVATRSSSLRVLKSKLKDALADILQGRMPIPKACESIGKRTFSGNSRIVSLAELVKQMKSEAETKFTLACSHDIGKALYFGVDHQDDELLSSKAILDVQWFVREVVAVFMKMKRCPDGKLENEIIQKKLLMDTKISSDHLVYILKSLHYMGFLVPFDEEWETTSNWSSCNLPKHLVVPALLNQKFSGWDLDGRADEHWFWGRRLDCLDRMSTLLPSGVFAMLQVQVRNLCKDLQAQKSFHLGDGWVSFRSNGVFVVIRVGGSTNKWIDRHWVDIMLVVPREDKRCMEADKLMKNIKDLVFRVCLDCPRLELVEMVIDPRFARKYVVESEDERLVTEDAVEALEQILSNVDKRGLDYIHAWPEHDTPVAELLLPSELQEHLEKWQSICQEYEKCVVPVYDTPALGSPVPKFENQDMQQLAEFMYQITTGQTRDIQLGLEDMNRTLRRIQASIDENRKKILANCSKILLKLDVECPRYPYLEDENTGFLSRYCNMFGRKVRLRYLCEHVEGGHQVEEACNGVGFVLEPEWYRKNAHILGPAIDILFFAAKLGANLIPLAGIPAAGLASGIACASVQSKLNECRRSFFGSEFNRKQPSREQVEDLFEFVMELEEVEHMDRARFIHKHFGLFPLAGSGGQQTWVCAKHKQGL